MLQTQGAHPPDDRARPRRPHVRRTGTAGSRRDVDLVDLPSRYPGTAAAVLWCVRHPLAVLVPFAVVVVLPLVDRAQPFDAIGFARVGRTMLTPQVWSVFADPWVQVGPLLLLSSGIWAGVADVMQLPSLLVVAAVHSVVVVVLGDVTTRLWVPVGRDGTAARWATGTALILCGLMERSFAVGHEEDLMVALMLACVAAIVVRRPVRGGLVLALACGLKAWAVLGGAVLLSGRRPSRVVVAGATTAAVVALVYLPFVVWGEVRTQEFSWGIAAGQSLFGRLARWWGLSDWGLRLVQGAVSGLVAGAVAWRRYGSALAVVIVAVAVRLLLEPHLLDYYCSPLLLLVVIWTWTTPDLRARWPRWAVLVGTVVYLQHYYFVGVRVLQLTEAATYAALAVLVLVTERRAQRRRAVGRSGPSTERDTAVDGRGA